MLTYDAFLSAMRRAYEEESGFPAQDATDIDIRLRLLAGQLVSLAAKADWLDRQLFADTAQGEMLDRHAAIFGLLRKEAATAQGELTFFREEAAQEEIRIPENTICALSGVDAMQYTTDAAAVLPAGALQVTVAARAMQCGRAGNAAAGTVTVMINAPESIAGVINSLPFTGGGNEERDEALRGRLIEGRAALANGANSAYYRERALRWPDVLSAAVVPRGRGAGTVDVVILTHRTDAGALAAEIERVIQEERELACDLCVRPAAVQAVAVHVRISAPAGADTAMIGQACEAAVRDQFDLLGIGRPLRLAELGYRLFTVGGVENYEFLIPQQDVAADSDAVLRLDTLTVDVV